MPSALPRPAVQTVGDNPVRLWGLLPAERHRRIAAQSGMDGSGATGLLLVNADFAFDPEWLRHVADRPGMVVTSRGSPVLAHARNDREIADVTSAMEGGGSSFDAGTMDLVAIESGPTIENKKLRKRETPFLMRLVPRNLRAIERASYFGAYKGVTDILTKYLWPEWALVLTRIAARIGMTPNMVTAIGAALCLAATFAFAHGHYWPGMAMGLGFMVLDTVDGKLARCTITSSWWGNVFDHGIDLVHPPFWWWFWATGLVHWGLGLSEGVFAATMGAIVAGYVLQRLVEGAFIKRFDGLEIHSWRRFDSRFRLFTARRNPNMVILFVSLVFARPDIGIVAVAIWTLVCLAVHVVQLFQAIARARGGGEIRSWMAMEQAQ